MPEPDPGAELDQASLGRRHGRLDRDTQPPGRPAARQTSARSPDGSAAASSTSLPVSVGHASSWRAKLSSMRPVNGVAPGRPNPRVQRPGQRRLQQRPRVVIAQPSDFQLREPG
jgi:hypothetical protein